MKQKDLMKFGVFKAVNMYIIVSWDVKGTKVSQKPAASIFKVEDSSKKINTFLTDYIVFTYQETAIFKKIKIWKQLK
jgi:hypothetical protein